MARTAASTSRTVVSVAGLVGLTSAATRVVHGTISRRISSRFALSSPVKRLNARQVAARPSKAGGQTEPYRVFGG